jgi:hypothetical protein
MSQAITTTPEQRSPAPRWAQSAFRFANWLIEDVGGGPRRLKLAWVINSHKLITFFVIPRHDGIHRQLFGRRLGVSVPARHLRLVLADQGTPLAAIRPWISR